MNKSLVLGIITTVLIIGGLIYYFYNTQVSVRETPALEAVPDDAAIVFELNDIPQAWANLYNSNLWKELKKSEDFSHFSARLVSLDSMVFNNSDFRRLLKNYKLFFSIHPTSSGKLNYLFIAELNGKLDFEYLDKWIVQAGGPRSSISKRVFNKIKIHELQTSRKQSALSYSIYDELLIFSETGSLVDDALRKMISGNPQQKKTFEPVRNLATPNVDANIYLNYANLPAFFRCFSNHQDPSLFNSLLDFAHISAFDLRINEEGFLLSGVTGTSSSSFLYLDIFRQQSPQKNSIIQILPSSTAFMCHLGVSDQLLFQKDLKEFLTSSGLSKEYRHFSDSLYSLYNLRIEDNLLPLLGNEAALLMNENTGINFRRDLFAVIKVSNVKTAIQNLDNIKRAVAARGGSDSVSMNYNGFAVSRLPLGNYLKLLYGGVFSPIESPFITSINDYLIFANDFSVLRQVIDAFKDGQTLAANETFKSYYDQHAATSNVSVIFNIPRCLALCSSLGSEGLISSISRNQYFYKKFEYAGIQYSSTNSKMFYSNINYHFVKTITEQTRKLWNSQLDTTPATKPYILYDAQSRQHVVLVQDVMNTLYLFENDGKMRWDKKLERRILSDIIEVDAMSNGQRQYLFNTEDHVFLLDANGNNILNYPIRLGAKASAGLTVLRPDSGDVRFYVPCENQNTYGYSVNGKLLEGWNPRTMEYNVKYELRKFKMGSRNYLYSSTERGTLYIWQQKGLRSPFNVKKETIFTTPYSYQLIDTSTVRLFSLDSSGHILCYAFGARADSIKPIFTGKGSFMEARDMDHDGHVEFLTGGNGNYRLFSESGKELATFNTGDSTALDPFFIEMNGKTKIGIASPANNKVYLFHHTGSSYSAFPVNGLTGFMTADFYQNGSSYIVIGDKKGFISLYQLK